MREIKFRAWHTAQKKMYSCAELVDDQMTLLTDGRFINVHSMDTRWSEIDNKGIMIPLQFTGLKDKNGKEIYEGDIVRYTHKNLNHPVDFNVIFFGGQFCQDKPDDKGYTPDIWYDWDEVDVIGNIYENPDLLEDT